MIVSAVMQHLEQLVQEPLLSALRPLLQNFPQLLLRAAHSGGGLGNAAGLFAQFQYQVQQVTAPLFTDSGDCACCASLHTPANLA